MIASSNTIRGKLGGMSVDISAGGGAGGCEICGRACQEIESCTALPELWQLP